MTDGTTGASLATSMLLATSMVSDLRCGVSTTWELLGGCPRCMRTALHTGNFSGPWTNHDTLPRIDTQLDRHGHTAAASSLPRIDMDRHEHAAAASSDGACTGGPLRLDSAAVGRDDGVLPPRLLHELVEHPVVGAARRAVDRSVASLAALRCGAPKGPMLGPTLGT